MQTQWTDNRLILIPCVDTLLEMWAQSECRLDQDKSPTLAPGINGDIDSQNGGGSNCRSLLPKEKQGSSCVLQHNFLPSPCLVDTELQSYLSIFTLVSL